MIETNKIYEISNKANGLYATTYLSFDNSGVSLLNKNESDINDYNLKWFLFPIDNNQYIITSYGVNKNKVWTANGNKINVTTYSAENSAQQWQIRNSSSGYIIENNNGKILTAGTGQSLGLLYLTDEIPEDSNQQWNLTSIQTISLPSQPIIDTTLVDYPKYSTTGSINYNGTALQLMGWTLIPCIMVYDKTIASTHTQITTTPYYILKKYQRWVLATGSGLSVPAHVKSTFEYEWGTDTDQKTSVINTLGFQINTDTKLKATVPEVGGGTTDIRTQITEELKVEYSSENKEMRKYKQSFDVDNLNYDEALNAVGFIVETSFELYRMNGNVLITSIKTTNKDTYNTVTYPNHKEVLLLLTNHSYEEVTALTGISKERLQNLKNNWKKR
ncbi:hypothetical protein ABE42_30535 [Bacillus thuringiensis]|uniref:44 kDa component of binary insecticidal crystal protein n=1 Tax=Bacillus thuringiensis TaxID=1428 RepID=Q93LP4_BACTU|nr:hypothetical protein [Bacillus thuringiensis]AAK64566.1 crystal protein ET76 [Bacillus thuringiensis]AAT29026.1 44 kDa component of binary insecticidal crystal protein [Bacillus thuringiensis]AAT29027.1 44 kDa component of binary insecticidal crystal protein [Bacillus thuringiensis]MBG9537567.1 hypothetical protein [Bacillus thuringiensis]MBG9583438.1 hypothetical protein [Bacillus thuringiensis]